MEYVKGYVYELMDQGGPTDNREPYFKEAVDEMMRARTLCAKANQTMPDDPAYMDYLEELFGRKLDNVRILTPFTCDFGNRVTFGKGVFVNRSAILSASAASSSAAAVTPSFCTAAMKLRNTLISRRPRRARRPWLRTAGRQFARRVGRESSCRAGSWCRRGF